MAFSGVSTALGGMATARRTWPSCGDSLDGRKVAADSLSCHNMEVIHIGLVGFGAWPRRAYAPLLEEHPAARVVAVAARSERSREAARETFGDDIAVTGDYRQLLESGDVDALMIALPNALHAEALQAAAKSNKHIFFEPPLADDAETAEQVLDALEQCTGIVQADLELGCLPVLEAVRGRISAAGLGPPRMAKIRLWCDWRYPGGAGVEETQGKSFFHWLGHWYLDVLECICGEPATRATVLGGRASGGTLIDHGWALLQYPGGLLGQFEFNLTMPQDTVIDLNIACARGELWADLKTGRWKWRDEAGPWRDEHSPASEPVHGFEGMRESINEFITAIRTGKPPRADLDVARRVQQSAQLCADAEPVWSSLS